MPRQSDAKQRMIKSAVKLQRMHGVAGTAFADVLTDSGAPRGSVYHHFPEGRGQLAAAATSYGADWIADELQQLLADGDIAAALEGFLRLWTGIVLEEDFEAGCAVAAGALDPAKDSPARAAAAEGFRRWEQIITGALAQHTDQQQAEALAVMTIAAVEGALILVRAEQSLRPLQLVARQLAQLAAVTIAGTPPDQVMPESGAAPVPGPARPE